MSHVASVSRLPKFTYFFGEKPKKRHKKRDLFQQT